MEIKKLDDSAQRGEKKPGLRPIPPLNTKISPETREALKQIDANIRTAEQKSGYLLVG
ncbi:hypothetical protein [Mesorhizobium sp. B2-9-1]|uniref:hypothetical protein n=1 Tax=Mesorhizobium sp. B2-9-1 TaxID=2589898 RepID=UPI0015E33D67|nr:hypothetical protein [Mesorhizobium sp. B2-9-1]